MKLLQNILNAIFSILWCVGTWILIQAYNHDLFMVKKSEHIFSVFFIIVSISSLLFLILEILSQIRQKKDDLSWTGKWFFSSKLKNALIIIEIVLIPVLIFVMQFIIGLVRAYISTIEVIALALPYFIFIILFISDGIQYINQKIKKSSKVNKRIVRGHQMLSGIFSILIIVLFINVFVYTPQWNENVSHTPLFSSGEEKGREYRIPAAIVLPGDIILAFSESRINNRNDWGDIDLVLKRSDDGGKTWSNIQVLIDVGDRTAGNPCPVYDNITKTVWLPYCIDNKEVFVISSSDNGTTWSDPVNITAQIGITLSGSQSPFSMEYGTGPGNGIQLSTGRLLIPSYYFDERGSHVIYSDDHGVTWQKGEDLNAGGECQVFEAENGSVCVNCRTNDGFRLIAWSHDGGETWDVPYLDLNLEDVGCMASCLKISDNNDITSHLILFSHPTNEIRAGLTLRLSYDDGNTWEKELIIFSGPSAYSQICILSNNTICILFEQGFYDYHQSIVFSSVDLDIIENV